MRYTVFYPELKNSTRAMHGFCHATTDPPKIGPPGPFMAATAGPPGPFAALQMVPPDHRY